MPGSEGCRWGPKNQRMAETQLIHPSLGGQWLSLLHRHGCAPWCSPRAGQPVFVLLFFNLGLKFPLKQSCLQQGRTRHQKVVGSLHGSQSQSPRAPPNPSPTLLDTIQHSEPTSKKSAAPSTLQTCHPPSRHFPAQGFERTEMLGAQGESSPSCFLCSVPSLGATGKDKEP